MLRWLALLCLLAVPAYAGDCPDGTNPAEDFSCPGDEVVEPEDAQHFVDGFEWRELTPAELEAGLAIAEKQRKPLLPPARFDYFNHNVRIIAVPARQVSATCNTMLKSPAREPGLVYACARQAKGEPCKIVLPSDGNGQAAMLRHEMGHCNGWPASHTL